MFKPAEGYVRPSERGSAPNGETAKTGGEGGPETTPKRGTRSTETALTHLTCKGFIARRLSSREKRKKTQTNKKPPSFAARCQGRDTQRHTDRHADKQTHTHTETHTHTDTHTHTHAHTHTHTHRRTQTYTNIHTHTHTLTVTRVHSMYVREEQYVEVFHRSHNPESLQWLSTRCSHSAGESH